MMFNFQTHEEIVKQKMFEIVEDSKNYSKEDVIRTIDEALKVIEQKEVEYDSVYYKGRCDGLENALSLMKHIKE